MRCRAAIALLAAGAAACTSADETGGADGGEVAECIDVESDPRNCGICGRTCVVPNGEAGCSAGECTVASCADGFFDNDGDPRNGCELESDCVPDSACATECGSTGTLVCLDGTAQACDLPAEQCNGIDDNCDGECDEGAIAGCRAPVHRSLGNGHLYTTDLAAATAAPFSLEAQNYFHVYAEQVSGTQPVFLCAKSDGKGLVTSSTSCESAGSIVLTLGYWATAEQCGATPLHRMYSPASNDHFYTTSAPERDNAVANFGYVSEGIAGYVWPAL